LSSIFGFKFKKMFFKIKFKSKLNQLVCNSIAAMPLNPVPTNYDLLVERLVKMSSDRFPINSAKLTIFEINDFLDRIKYPNNIVVRMFIFFIN
jgi:hypothetical protein